MEKRTLWCFVLLTGLSWVSVPPVSAEIDEALHTLRQVGREGQGNAAASPAWRRVAQAKPEELVSVLQAMDDANPFAVNWLRAAVETIAARTVAGGHPLPLAPLGQFLLDTRHSPHGRRLAFELIAQADARTAEKLLPGLLNDPAGELRRDAVQALMDQARGVLAQTNQPGAALLYRQALGFAREVDQIDAINGQLRELGQPADLLSVLGFLARWRVIGPFDNTGGSGFERVFPPETALDFAATYDGKAGKVQWTETGATNEYGIVDLNRPCGKLKEVTAYACTEFESEHAQAAELRLGCENAWKVWLNGRFLFGRAEYHRGKEIDQYRLPIQLQAGRNTILVKVCQNEQAEEWTVEWEFQLRLCDALGTPIQPAVKGGAR